MKRLLHKAFFVITGTYILAFGTHAVAARECLTADRTYHFATNGNDANSGSEEAPWRTPQHAVWHVGRTIDLCGRKVTIKGGDGTYDPFVVSGPFVGAESPSSVTIQCNIANPNQCSISAPSDKAAAIIVQFDAAVTIEGFQVAAAGVGSHGRGVLVNNGVLNLGVMGYAACEEAHIHAAGPRATLQVVGTQVIYGNSKNHVLAESGALVAYNGAIVHILADLNFEPRAFAQATERGEIDFTGTAFVPKKNELGEIIVTVTGPSAWLQSFGLIKGSSGFLYQAPGNALPGSGAVLNDPVTGVNQNNEGLFK